MPPRNLYEQRRARRARLLRNNILNQTRRFKNNPSTVDQIVQLTMPQVTNDPFERDFFNGAAFQYHNNVLEPVGWDFSPFP
ncbi:hypothetical protein RclHR1_03310004 [Rhizophagus clarus]|uniref:Uncharacterized protein n=1 Tax=Rhizophagus clarus TaxID=94130 RepID=A0A2Z6R9F6_9GLOM|nr:hypothetical protein RclHR1_03310004 [Rhizophagus clarus]GES95528.1 hypothetical protein GLOIN_2v1552491 [Rhizophagus clarus]